MNYKLIISHIVAVAVGVGLGYILTKKHIEASCEAILQEELDSIKAAFEASRSRSMSKEDAEKISNVNVIDHPSNPSGILNRSSLDNNPYEQAKRKYKLGGIDFSNTQRIEPDGAPDEDEEDPDDELDDGELRDDAGKTEKEMMDLTKINRTRPYLIDDREYSEEFDHHDKVSLYYYRIDDVLTEENEEIIDNVDGIVGYDALSALDMQTTVWVRNEPLGIDYEIIGINKTYAETVLGIKQDGAMTPRERYVQQRKKRSEKDGGE